MRDENETAEKPQPTQVQQIVAVPSPLFKQTLDLLQNELPMAKVRNIVLSLEQCRVLSLGVAPAEDGGSKEDDGTTSP